MGTEIYKTLLEDLNKGEEVALITKYNLETKKVEKNIYNLEELEGKNLEYVNKAKEKNLIANIKINDEESVLAEVFKSEHRLIVFGAGHVGYHLCHFASKVGFNTIVVDDRPYFANKEKFGDNIQVICNTFENAFEILDIHEEDYVVIVTRGHKHDKFCLEKILSLDELNYIGMIGSKRRVKIMKEELIEEGYSKEKIENIYSPIGLNIGAVTPEEIAISILAEIISVKRIGKLAVKNEPIKVSNSCELNKDVLEALAKSQNEKMSLVTVISTKGSTPRKAGSKMIVYDSGMIIGTIGGGCAEAKIIKDAALMAGSKNLKIETIDMTGEIAEEEGMVCGGKMTVLIEAI
ncbi:XdhC family protein [Intestinibacter bartlettii]|uniref:XdhC family protein n=1 Tax=Intestinibacter bartlettii TaxID=261299 RepID=UPI00082318DE|nr:XdhC family protein [Intestinibacter bartlettii]SCI57674.1 xanthine dehydrogenase accessory protein XdhC [uncultured Clostridium sp.]